MTSTIVALMAVGLGSAIAGRWAGWRTSRLEPDDQLDSDAVVARVNWASDFVALSTMALTAGVVTTVQLVRDSREIDVLVTAVVMGLCAVVALWFLVVHARKDMDGYPFTLVRERRDLRTFLGKFPFVLPGLLLYVVSQIVLAIVAA